MKNCCLLHKTGKYQHWTCSESYDSLLRHNLYENRKKPCNYCGVLCSPYAIRCKKCLGKFLGEKRRGKKLPLWWRKKISEGQMGERHPRWKGDKAGYSAIHKWIYKNWGMAKKCKLCASKKFVQWANKTGLYKRDKRDWLQLCAKCHNKYDRSCISCRKKFISQ